MRVDRMVGNDETVDVVVGDDAFRLCCAEYKTAQTEIHFINVSICSNYLKGDET